MFLSPKCKYPRITLWINLAKALTKKHEYERISTPVPYLRPTMPSPLAPRITKTTVSGGLGYYPFGMMQEGRKFVGGMGYRWGMNGQEKVDEIKGSGNHYTAMFWEYDSRLGRRWNQDPKPNPSISNYTAFANNPIWYSDPLGDTIKVEGGFFFRARIKTKLQVMRMFSTKEIRGIVKDLRRNKAIITINDEAGTGSPTTAFDGRNSTIRMYKMSRDNKKSTTPGKNGGYVSCFEKGNLANELSHAFDNINDALNYNDATYVWPNGYVEHFDADEPLSNQRENMVRRWRRKIMEDTHTGEIFDNVSDTRKFNIIMRAYSRNPDRAHRMIVRTKRDAVRGTAKDVIDRQYE
jgi:hypothetical protein